MSNIETSTHPEVNKDEDGLQDMDSTKSDSFPVNENTNTCTSCTSEESTSIVQPIDTDFKGNGILADDVVASKNNDNMDVNNINISKSEESPSIIQPEEHDLVLTCVSDSSEQLIEDKESSENNILNNVTDFDLINQKSSDDIPAKVENADIVETETDQINCENPQEKDKSDNHTPVSLTECTKNDSSDQIKNNQDIEVEQLKHVEFTTTDQLELDADITVNQLNDSDIAVNQLKLNEDTIGNQFKNEENITTNQLKLDEAITDDLHMTGSLVESPDTKTDHINHPMMTGALKYMYDEDVKPQANTDDKICPDVLHSPVNVVNNSLIVHGVCIDETDDCIAQHSDLPILPDTGIHIDQSTESLVEEQDNEMGMHLQSGENNSSIIQDTDNKILVHGNNTLQFNNTHVHNISTVTSENVSLQTSGNSINSNVDKLDTNKENELTSDVIKGVLLQPTSDNNNSHSHDQNDNEDLQSSAVSDPAIVLRSEELHSEINNEGSCSELDLIKDIKLENVSPAMQEDLHPVVNVMDLNEQTTKVTNDSFTNQTKLALSSSNQSGSSDAQNVQIETCKPFTVHVDVGGITFEILPTLVNKKVLYDQSDGKEVQLETWMSQKNTKNLKPLLRMNYWSHRHELRGTLWQRVCKLVHNAKGDVYSDMEEELFRKKGECMHYFTFAYIFNMINDLFLF